MRGSEYTSTPSREMAIALKAAYGGPMPVVLPNAFPLQLQPRPLIRQDPPSFFWFSQTVGEGRGLEAFLTAWTRTRIPSQVCLLGDVSWGYRERLMRLISETHRCRLTFLPLVSPHDLPGRIAQYDIGLALEPPVPESRFLTATNKIFQYMNAGLAILATPTAGQKEVLSMVPDAGMFVDLQDTSGLAAKLDALLEDPMRLAAMGSASRRGAEQHFSWENFTPLLVASVKRALGPRETRS
jgi:glycosyltransferase involved in cell wall biosynthesis